MAGYIFLLARDGVEESLKTIVKSGCFSPNIPLPKDNAASQLWTKEAIGAFGDLITIGEGDKVFFFSERTVYGCGKAVSLHQDSCILKNYPNASRAYYAEEQNDLFLVDSLSPRFSVGDKYKGNRWFVTFEPDPFFFQDGVDMDDLLGFAPTKIRMLRVIEKVSFIKLDDDEANEIYNCICLRTMQRKTILNSFNTMEFSPSVHEQIREKLASNQNPSDYIPNSKELVLNRRFVNGEIDIEMAEELALLYHLKKSNDPLFGSCDYLCQQVPASPFKPVIYIDRIDLFGYSYLKELDGGFLSEKVKKEYLIVELKKGIVQDIQPVVQVMKYVDFVANEYAEGDYSRIRAILLAKEFSDDVIDESIKRCQRNFTMFFKREAYPLVWQNFNLINYQRDENSDCGLSFTQNTVFAQRHGLYGYKLL